MRLLRIAVLITIALIVSRIVLGLGFAWLHYENTDPYSKYLAEHPVSSEYLAGQVSLKEANFAGDDFQSGAIDPDTWNEDSDFDLVHHTMTIEVGRGDDEIFRMEQKLNLALEKDTWDHLGAHFSTPVFKTNESYRSILLIWLDPQVTSTGKSTAGTGAAMIDIFLVSGAGESQVLYLDLADRSQAYGNMSHPLPIYPDDVESAKNSARIPIWQVLAGIVNNLEGLPEEGLIHYFSAEYVFNWKPKDGGHTIGGHRNSRHYCNTNEYSYSQSITLESGIEGGVSHASTSSSKMSRRWSDNIW